MRIVFVTQTFDPDSPILGVTRDWVAALAGRCDGVDVIAVAGRNGASSRPNVRVASLGEARGHRKLGRLRAFYGVLGAWIRGASAVFVHMVPRYAVLAAPLTLVGRRPLALWYAQGGVDATLRVASRVATWILTPTRDSFPLASAGIDRRVHVTGHGIDTGRYVPADGTVVAPGRLLSVGRLSPSKRYEVLLAALACLGQTGWHLRIAGGPLSLSDRAYEARLKRQAAELGIARQVEFAGMIPYRQVVAHYQTAWALAHTSATGSLDKVVLEAMACATPVVSTAAASRGALGDLAEALWCGNDAPERLSRRIGDVLAWDARRRRTAGELLRRQVEAHHSLARWADRVIQLLSANA